MANETNNGADNMTKMPKEKVLSTAKKAFKRALDNQDAHLASAAKILGDPTNLDRISQAQELQGLALRQSGMATAYRFVYEALEGDSDNLLDASF